jgi:hypothetical protein
LQWLVLIVFAMVVMAFYMPGVEYLIQQILNWFGASL